LGLISPSLRFFIFIFFISVFYKNIFSIWKFTEVYPGRPAAGRPGPGRPAAGGRDLNAKKRRRKIADRSLGPVARQRGGRPPWPSGSGAAGPPGRPAAGRPAPPGRPAAGRPALPPLYKGWLVPPPLICITTIPETKEKERGRERGEALPDFRAGDCR